MQFLELLQLVGAAGFVLSLAPQLVRTIRRGRAQDVDVWFLVILLASSAILLYYAFRTRQYWFACSYLANLLVWGVVLYYRLRPRPASVERSR